uniref:Uncharacterized protein n=1 Tax=Lygus hesperus TaxID=30085 RepID=A0A0A9XE07_LYGHE
MPRTQANGKVLHVDGIVFVPRNRSIYFPNHRSSGATVTAATTTAQNTDTTATAADVTAPVTTATADTETTQDTVPLVNALQTRLEELKKQLHIDTLTVQQKQAIMKTIGYTIKQIKALQS